MTPLAPRIARALAAIEAAEAEAKRDPGGPPRVVTIAGALTRRDDLRLREALVRRRRKAERQAKGMQP